MSDHNPVEKGQIDGGSQGTVIDIFRELLSFATSRGKVEIGRAQEKGKHQLAIHQLKRDRRARLEKLGREVMALVDGDEIDHPGVSLHVTHIREIEARIQQMVSLEKEQEPTQVSSEEHEEE